MKQVMRRVWVGMALCLGGMGPPGRAEVPFLEEVGVGSFWLAHLNPAAVRGTPIEQCLDQLGAGGALREFQQLIAAQLGGGEWKLESTTLFDAGEPGGHVVMILRGDFPGLAPSAPSATRIVHRGKSIVEGPPWRGAPLFLARIAEDQFVVGTSRRGVERAIDRLDGLGKSWQAAGFPPELPSAAAVFALDMAKLAVLLDFEAELTRSLHRLWAVARVNGDDVEFSISLEGSDPIRLGEMEGQLLSLLPVLAASMRDAVTDEPAIPNIAVEHTDRWLRLSLTAPPDDIAAFLNGMARVFTGPAAAEPPGADD